MKNITFFLILPVLLHFALAAVIGIDYGEEFIKAMVVSPKAPLEIILTPEAKRKEVSGLAIKKFGKKKGEIERVYGSTLGSVATRFPQNTILHIKPLLGKTIDDETDISRYSQGHPGTDIVSNARNSLSFVIDNVQYPTEELVAMNLQEIINRANLFLRERDPSDNDAVDKLVLTVPEYFDQYQRRALLDSGSLTSVNTVLDTYLVPDGLAVIINFVLRKRDFKGKSYYIVYDVGGGATKASLFSIQQPSDKMEALRIEFGGYGYSLLGGYNLTLQIADLVEKKLLSQHTNIRSEELHSNPKAVTKIIQAAEKAKLILSVNFEASVTIESVLENIDFKTTITKQEFEGSLSENSSEILNPLKDALDGQLWDEKIIPEELSGIILTGGSSRVPFIQYKLAEYLGENKILKNVNADEAPVDGATIRGIKLFEAFRTKPLNITEHSISDYSATLNGKEDKKIVFPKGTIFPVQRTVTFDNSKELSNNFEIALWENNLQFQIVKVEISNIHEVFSAEKCPNGVIYNSTFSISQNRLFSLDKIEAICITDGSFTSFKERAQNASDKKIGSGNYKRLLKLMPLDDESGIKIMSFDERSKLGGHIKTLDQKDAARFELEEAKNLLEALLYDSRSYSELKEVVDKAPQSYLGNLTEAIVKHLSWLEDEADEATKVEIIARSNEVQKIRDKLAAYLQSLSEPLDSKQFKKLLNNANELLNKVNSTQINEQNAIDSLRDKFEAMGHNVEEQYGKIKLPYHISAPLNNWNDTLSAFKEVMKLVEYATFNSAQMMGREQLFEIKSAFDMASAELKSIIDYFGKARDYRLRGLQSWIQRAEKSKKRKEERLKKKMEQREKEKQYKGPSFSLPETSENESSFPIVSTVASTSTTPTYISSMKDKKKTTMISTVTTPIHDEL